MNFLDTMDVPIVEPVRGVDVTFPLLEIDDYLPWCAELASKIKADIRKKATGIDPVTRLPRSLSAADRADLERRIDAVDVGLDMPGQLVWTIAGAQKVLRLSLAKAGISEADQTEILRRIRPNRLHLLARDVSALYEVREKSDPNDGTSATSQNADETSPETDASSSSTSDSQRGE